MTVLTLADAQLGAALFFAFMTPVMALTTGSLWKALMVLSRWPRLWSWDERRRCVVMTAPRELALWEASLPLFTATFAVPVGTLILALQKHGVALGPWSHRPRLAGRTHEGMLIVTHSGEEAVFPCSCLPIGMRQLDRLLATYWLARNRTLLDTPQALDHVLTTLQPTPEELADTPWMWRSSPTAPPPAPQPTP